MQLLELTLVTILLIVVLSPVVLVPIWMYKFQKRRDAVFARIASKYNLQFHMEAPLLDSPSPFEPAKQDDRGRPLRICKGTLHGKNISLGDFYYSNLPNWYGPSRLLVKYGVPIRGWYGVHTILSVNGDQKDIGSSLTGYASEEEIVEVVEAI